MNKNSVTAAGPSDSPQTSDALVDAINQVFAIFRRNYHNQYFKAFPDEKELNITKRLWLDSLKRFTPEILLHACKVVIETREFLPTLHTMLAACEQLAHKSLPDAHSAYIEACRASSPKAAAAWSHLAVYYAGKACDWFFLHNNPENVAWPVFREKYLELCQRVMQGEQLAQPQVPALPADTFNPLDKNENLRRLDSLKTILDL